MGFAQEETQAYKDAQKRAQEAAMATPQETAQAAAAIAAMKRAQEAAALAATQKRFAGYVPKEIKTVKNVGPIEAQRTLGMRESALQGYQAPELEAMRTQMAVGQQAGQQQRERAMQAALAKQGIRGGAAASLRAQQAQQAYREKGTMDTEMLMKQEERKRQALGEYEKGIGDAYGREQRRQLVELATKLAGEQSWLSKAGQEAAIKAAEEYSTGQKALAQVPGGCCMIVAVVGNVAIANGISEARADEIINKSKSNDLVFLNNKEKQFVNDLAAARACRDHFCSIEQKRGYYIFSEKFAPKVKKSKLLTKLGYSVMVKPGIELGKSITENKKPSKLNKLIAKSWIKVFELFSTKTPFKRSNGEIV